MKKNYTLLEEKLGHTFADKMLLEKALIHRSFRYETADVQIDNQRLEFLGDAVLGLISAEFLFVRYPHFQEGELTQRRSALTKSPTLTKIARKIDLGPWLQLGHGEKKSGGATRDSNLTDMLEALIGALYLDAGLPAVRRFFIQFFADEMENLLGKPAMNNPKGFLQNHVRKVWKTEPEYLLINTEGPSHNLIYTYQVMINGTLYGQGTATNKRKAQALAATEAIDKLKP